ncbi:MAG: hypothetical protein VKM01_05450 [Cyanobacteriota bacterium]|nr:hypothetical protein [Cyanobacteriota bacterium]
MSATSPHTSIQPLTSTELEAISGGVALVTGRQVLGLSPLRQALLRFGVGPQPFPPARP